jgi:predicted methyltransferase
MKVADVLAYGGYFSELLSYIVGPTGHVLLLNNTASDEWSGGGWEKRLAGNCLPNVEHRTLDLQHLDLPDHSLDALVLIKVYHDFYWLNTDPKDPWPKMDPAVVLDQLTRVLKPGGLLLLEDHSAKPGTGSADAGTLHRIEEAYAVHDFERRGFKVIARSDLLRRPDDKRELVSWTPPGLGKTDRFVLVFRKQ